METISTTAPARRDYSERDRGGHSMDANHRLGRSLALVRSLDPLAFATQAAIRENLGRRPGTSGEDNLIERLPMGNGPINKLRVYILSQDNLLCGPRLLLRPRHIPRRLLLQDAKHFSGNLYDIFTHVHPLPPCLTPATCSRMTNANSAQFLITTHNGHSQNWFPIASPQVATGYSRWQGCHSDN